MEQDTTDQQPQIQNTSSQSPVTLPVIKKKFPVKIVLTSMLVLILIAAAGGIYYTKLQIKKSVPVMQTKKISDTQTSPSALPKTQISPSEDVNSISATPTPLSNVAEIGTDKTILLSPDKTKIATYYNSSPEMGEGTPSFNKVDLLDKTTEKTATYKLSGAITYALDRLFWSPLDNRIYFVNATNGLGIYGFWSVNPDGTDAKLISGELQPGDKDYQTTWNNSGIFGASTYNFSPDGKMIATIKSTSTEKQTIWIMNYDGTGSREIAIQGTYENLNKVAWESDGQHLVFTDWHGSYGTNYLISLSGGTPTKTGSQN